MGSNKRKRSGKERKKAKKRKHSKESKSRRSASEDSSSEDDEVPDFIADSQNAPIAAEYARAVLRKYPALKHDLRTMLWKIDNESGVNIDALPDAQLKGALRGMFTYLNLRHTKQGMYALRARQDGVLRRIGCVFFETHPNESHKPLHLPGDPVPRAQSPAARSPLPASRRNTGHSPQPRAPTESPSVEPPPSSASLPVPVSDRSRSPSPPEPAVRVLGPAPPSMAMRQAAADAAASMADQGLLEDILGAVSEDVVGPAPPASLLADLAKAPQDAREAEAQRIVSVLDKAARLGDVDPDAYEVMQLEEGASGSDAKKRFWRLSLLIHPDKCEHEHAAVAFDVIKRAAQTLQDSGARKALDARRHTAREAALNREVAAELAKERKWRILQGKATAEDLELESMPERPKNREEWMTVLPEARGAKPAYMEQKSVTAFSDGSRRQEAPAASSWTALPGQATAPHALQGPSTFVQPVSKKAAITAKNEELLRLATAEAQRAAQDDAAGEGEQAEQPQSLLEKHKQMLDEAKAERKRRRKEAKGKDGAAQAPRAPEGPRDWAEAHPWRPFDREKDLQASTSQTKGRFQAMVDGDSNLASRFRKAS